LHRNIIFIEILFSLVSDFNERIVSVTVGQERSTRLHEYWTTAWEGGSIREMEKNKAWVPKEGTRSLSFPRLLGLYPSYLRPKGQSLV
jgi:hypothetical protein